MALMDIELIYGQIPWAIVTCLQAQVSLDLALGRGGDQAIVRIGKDTKAFGGQAPTSVSSTRVRVRVVAQALKAIIEGADLVLVMIMSAILGMGVPGVAAYVIVQAVAVPVLILSLIHI